MPRDIEADDLERYGEYDSAVIPIGLPVQLRKPISATPFTWRDEAEIPPRQWLYGKHLLRRFVSLDIAAGGVGKSSLKIGEALAMTSGRELYGKLMPEGKLRVWLFNLEDPREETERRIAAAAKYFRVTEEDVGGRLFMDSGRDQECVIAEETRAGTHIVRPVADAVAAAIEARAIDVLILDPFVSSHAVNENDNRAIDMVAKEWARIADKCSMSVNLVHHVRKQNGQEASADSARGAKALTDAARSVVVYNRMTSEEAEKAGISTDQVGFYFRVQNDKANLAPAERAEWFRMNNVDLANGDSVGVACRWTWPDAFDGITAAMTRACQEKIADGEWRRDVRTKDEWVGHPIAEVLGLDTHEEKDKARLGDIIKQWIKNRVLIEVAREGKQRRKVSYIIPGELVIE